MKLCSVCGVNPCTRRGVTCGPVCAQSLRSGTPPTGASSADSSGPGETFEQDANHYNVSLNKTRIKTLEELVEHCSVDLRIWEVERFVCNKWEVGAKINEVLSVEPLFQVKAWFKKKHVVEFAVNDIEAMKSEASKWSPRVSAIKRGKLSSGNMLELDIPDIHFGKLAWGKETGYANYDTALAIKTYSDAIDKIIQGVAHIRLDQILFVVGNDMFQMDNTSNTTTKGTVVDSDSRYKRVFKIARQEVIRKIDQLKAIAPVLVKVVPGNHDEHASFHLGDSLECWFRNDKNVMIDNAPTHRKFHQHGDCMIMYFHGDKGKRKDYPLMMAAECSRMWGDTKYREIHTGHFHGEIVDEQHGIKVRTLSSLSGADAWHVENGYTGNLREAQGLVWNKTKGLVFTAHHLVEDHCSLDS